MVGSRGDKDLQYNWKLYESSITNVLPDSKEVVVDTQTTNTAVSTESYQNCTEMRKVYPNGVPSTHQAYETKHDRDKDNFACER